MPQMVQSDLRQNSEEKHGRRKKLYDVKGKWALITGAARGIGYLTAKFMAAQGCSLY